MNFEKWNDSFQIQQSFRNTIDNRTWNNFLQILEKNKFNYDFINKCYSYFDYNYETENRFKNIYDWVQKYDICLEKDYCRIMGIEYIPIKKYTWNYLTISPFPKLDYTDENKHKLFDFCVNIFNKINMKKFHFVIESGKDQENPHLHIHALFVYNKGINKNWKRNVIKLYNKTFTNSKIDWYTKKSRGWYNQVINPMNNKLFDVMIKDKLDYFNNSKKTVLHNNFEDIGLRGSSED